MAKSHLDIGVFCIYAKKAILTTAPTACLEAVSATLAKAEADGVREGQRVLDGVRLSLSETRRIS